MVCDTDKLTSNDHRRRVAGRRRVGETHRVLRRHYEGVAWYAPVSRSRVRARQKID